MPGVWRGQDGQAKAAPCFERLRRTGSICRTGLFGLRRLTCPARWNAHSSTARAAHGAAFEAKGKPAWRSWAIGLQSYGRSARVCQGPFRSCCQPDGRCWQLQIARATRLQHSADMGDGGIAKARLAGVAEDCRWAFPEGAARHGEHARSGGEAWWHWVDGTASEGMWGRRLPIWQGTVGCGYPGRADGPWFRLSATGRALGPVAGRLTSFQQGPGSGAKPAVWLPEPAVLGDH